MGPPHSKDWDNVRTWNPSNVDETAVMKTQEAFSVQSARVDEVHEGSYQSGQGGEMPYRGYWPNLERKLLYMEEGEERPVQAGSRSVTNSPRGASPHREFGGSVVYVKRSRGYKPGKGMGEP